LVRLGGLKRNTLYSLELILINLFKNLLKLQILHVVIQLDTQMLRKKKTILALFQKFDIKVVYLNLYMRCAFNGVSLCRKRRV
jgi:hypothetical protein